MNFIELVKQRQSDRAFDPTREVEPEKFERILEAARMAPSACNAQPWHFVVVDEPELRDTIAAATSNRVLGINHFTRQAPIHLLIVEEKANISSSFGSWAKRKHFPHIDIGIVAAHIVLAARAEGLGSCIVGWFDEKRMKQALEIPSSRRVVLDILIGYSSQPTRNKVRKEIEKITSYNEYGRDREIK